MKYDVVMWDVDGTIIDSEPLYDEAIRYAAVQCAADISYITEEQLCGLHTAAVWDLIQQSNTLTHNYATWLGLLEEFYIANQAKLKPIDHSAEIIRYFHSQGLQQVCVSNSSRKIIEINLKQLGIRNEIKFIISVDDVEKAKPDPEPYLLALSEFQGKRVIAVEDSITGVKAANAAHISVVKYRPTQFEFKGLTISHLDELKAIVV